MKIFSRSRLHTVLGACIAPVLLAALVACAVPVAPATPAPLTAPRIAQLVASPDRSAADRVTDARRQPEQFLAFIGVRPGMVALDVSAGGGYTTELLARAIGPTGTVYGQSRPLGRPAPMPAQSEGAAHPAPVAAAASAPVRLTSPASLALREASLRSAGTAAATIVAVVQPFEQPVPAALTSAGLDLVTLVFNYHDFGFLGVDRAQLNLALFRALKPGGVYVVVDHAGRPGTGISESGTLHRIEAAFARREIEAAGFRFAGEADFLHNPADPRDRNTPEPAQPKDGFVLKFVKP